MADNNNIYFFPRTCGPLLIEYYSKLLKEPIPQQLKDLLSMLEEASAEVPADAEAAVQAAPQRPDKPK